MQTKYYNGINIFKFLAAFVIAQFYHYGILFGSVPFESSSVVQFLGKYGFFFVEFFFVISGFFTMQSLSKRQSGGDMSITRFMAKKISRLYPQFFLSIVVVLIGQLITIGIYSEPMVAAGTDNMTLSLILSLLCINCGWISNHDATSINGPTWYISILIICYLITAIINKLCRDSKKRVIAYVVMVLIGMEMLVLETNFPLAYMSCARGYMAFFMGMLVYSIINSSLVKNHGGVVNVILFVLLAAVIGLIVSGYELNTLVVAIVAAPTVVSLLVMPNKIDAKIPSSISNKLGEWSYSLYLMNIPAIVIIKLLIAKMNYYLDYSRIDIWLVVTLITMVFTIVSNDVFERLIIKRKKRIT